MRRGHCPRHQAEKLAKDLIKPKIRRHCPRNKRRAGDTVHTTCDAPRKLPASRGMCRGHCPHTHKRHSQNRRHFCKTADTVCTTADTVRRSVDTYRKHGEPVIYNLIAILVDKSCTSTDAFRQTEYAVRPTEHAVRKATDAVFTTADAARATVHILGARRYVETSK